MCLFDANCTSADLLDDIDWCNPFFGFFLCDNTRNSLLNTPPAIALTLTAVLAPHRGCQTEKKHLFRKFSLFLVFTGQTLPLWRAHSAQHKRGFVWKQRHLRGTNFTEFYGADQMTVDGGILGWQHWNAVLDEEVIVWKNFICCYTSRSPLFLLSLRRLSQVVMLPQWIQRLLLRLFPTLAL